MAVRAWVMVQTEVGRARAVCDALAAMAYPGVTVVNADTVTGPHDVILRVEADSLEALTDATDVVSEEIGGVQHVLTCLAIT
jgi:DNA-binding Lrp family transcriptional regulator